MCRTQSCTKSQKEEEYISESDYSDSLDLLFPKEEAAYAVLTAYIDESKVEENNPVIAVGGGVGTGLQWRNLCNAWRKALDAKGIGIFHTKDFETPEGYKKHEIYKHWSEPERKDFQKAIVDAIKNNPPEVSIAATIPVSEFLKVKPTRRLTPKKAGKYGDAFFFCAFMLIEQIVIHVDKTFGGDQRVTYYFEQGGDHQSLFERAYAAIADNEEAKRYYRFWLTPQFVGKDFCTALQVADKLVYEAAKDASHYFDESPPEKHSMYVREERRKVWKTRYPTQELLLSGLDIHTRWYDAKELADFYTAHGIGVALEKRKDFISKLASKADRKAKRKAKR